MNDDFLHRLRKEPSAKYLKNLKASLDRQAERQVKTRRTLLRTAILAALIGGSAVAVAFVAWRGVAHRVGTVANVQSAAGDRPAPAKNLMSSPNGGGAVKPSLAAELNVAIAARGDAAAPIAPTAVEVSRAGFSLAGVGGLVLNAENFLRSSILLGGANRPKTTQTTTSQAIAMLCRVRGSAGADSATADLVGTDRRISEIELATCKRNGVRVTELRPGYEAVVLARSKLYGAPTISARDIFLALAARVPDLPDRPRDLISNPYRVWNAIDSGLPAEQIEILGPQWSSLIATAFKQTVMEAGCATFPEIVALREKNPEAFDKVCHSLRQDGAYREMAKATQDNVIAGHLDTYPNAMALLSFIEASYRPSVVMVSIDSVAPSKESILDGSYAGARPLYIYVNSTRAASVRPIYDFAAGLERLASSPWPEMSLVALDSGQQRAYMQNLSALPELILESAETTRR
jgi:phosphate transport system substrate-binding protein